MLNQIWLVVDEYLQDYLQKMEATKKAVGAVKGGKFKQKEGTPKVALNF